MKFAVFGIGGIGGLFGGMLAKAGYETTFLARGAVLSALQENGLAVESIMGNFSLASVQASGNPKDVGPVDAVLVATKAWQVPDAARQIRPMVAAHTVVVPLQNGVEAFDQLAAVLGADRVLGGLCHVLTFTSAPGVIKHVGMKPSITLGEWNNGRTQRLDHLVQCLRDACFEVRIPDSIQVALWEKFLYIASLGGVGAVCRCPVGLIRTLPETKSLLLRASREIVALAHAYGIPVPDTALDHAWKLLESLPPEGTSSMQRDVMGGRPSELAALSGAVVRLARVKGIACPVHEFIYGALLPSELRARGERNF